MQYQFPSRLGVRALTLAVALTCASTLFLPTDQAAAKKRHVKADAAIPKINQAAESPAVGAGPSLPRPAFSPTPLLVYRATPKPAGTADGISCWVRGDGLGGTIRLRAMVSGGAATSPTPIPGSDSVNSSLWPAWLSNPVPINFTGWKLISVPLASLTYRAPSNAAPDAVPAKFADADTVGIDTNRRFGTIYIDDIAWGSGDDPANSIDTFETTLTDWRLHGTPEALSAVRVVASHNLSKNDAGSMKIDFSTRAVADNASLAYLRSQAALATSPAVVFVPASPLKRELPDALPATGEAGLRIETFACPDQIQATSFTVYAKSSLTSVTVKQKGPLNMLALATPPAVKGKKASAKSSAAKPVLVVGKRLKPNAVDISVVKVTKEHGTGAALDPDATGLAPTMLLKDDRVSIAMPDANAPVVRLTGDPVTDIAAHTQKQFWIKVAIPDGTPAGLYTSILQVSGQNLKPFDVTLAVNVLPLRLQSPSKQYAIGYHGKLETTTDPKPSLTDFVSDDVFNVQLNDMLAHGIRYSTLTDKSPDIWRAVDDYNKAGMGTPFLLTGFASEKEAEDVEAERVKSGASQFYYLDGNHDTLKTDLVDFKTGKMMTATVVQDAQTETDCAENLDLGLYRCDHPHVQQLIASCGDRQSNTRDWLYWNAAQPDPLVNRLYTGFLLWKANLYGAYASDYQTSYGTDPFDDTQSPSGASAGLRPQMLTYPAQGGVIDTVQWEAIREGVTDVRYLTTFYGALRECKDNHVAKATVTQSEAAVDAFLKKPLDTMSDADLQAGRLMIAKYAITLRQAVDAYYKAHKM